MNVKVKLVNKHKSATADLWHYSGIESSSNRNYDRRLKGSAYL